MAYGKIWKEMFEGSMAGAGAVRQIVFVYACANADINDIVDLNPIVIGALVGCGTEEAQEAIEWLQQEDTRSRTKNVDKEDMKIGKRLERKGEYQYFIPNRKKYTMLQSLEQRKRVDRISSRKHRAKTVAEAFGDKFNPVVWGLQDKEDNPGDYPDRKA